MMPGEYRVLGSVEVFVNGVALDVGPARQRRVLAALLTEPGQVVPTDQLVDRVWGERAPAAAHATLRTHVSRLRQALSDVEGVAIVRRAGGYVLTVDPDSVDLHRFRALAARETGRAPRLAHLDQALALWHGPAFAGMDTPWFNALRETLDLERADVEGDRAELLGGSRKTPQIRSDPPAGWTELGSAVVAYRRQRGWTQEELAEHAGLGVRTVRDLETGRVRTPRRSSVRLLADAFALQGAERDRFLGIEDAAPAGTLGTGGGSVVPAQLPAALPALVGRDSELAELDAMLRAANLTAVHGTAGVGKAALAVYWAHRVAPEFPDGQLYVNLRGYDPTGEPMSPAEAVRGFLDALGVPAERIPPTLHAQAALYRSRLDGRRVLVLLDNARDAEQVRALLPGTATAFVLVTSRNQLTSLVAVDGARSLGVAVLGPDHARALLASRLGTARIRDERPAVDEIVARCAGLPLALTIAAARAAQSGFPLRTVAADLSARRYLDTLDAGDPAGQVRAVFSWSYGLLGEVPARLFRLLGLPPAPDISASAAASLAGIPMTRVHGLLADLTRASLVTEHAPGRYALHDLLRAYAADLAGTQDPPDQRQAAMRQWLDHLLHTAHRATTLARPHQAMIEIGAPLPGVEPETLTDSAEAMSWLQAEFPVLATTVTYSEEAGLPEYVWPLAWAVGEYAHRQAHWDDLPVLFQAALRSTRALGDVVGQASAHRSLARAYTWLDRFDDAHEQYQAALELFARTGDLVTQGRIHHGLCELSERSGDHAAALRHAEKSLELYRRADDSAGQARALNAAGWCLCLLDRPDQAVAACQDALRLLRQVGDRVAEAETWDSLGYALQLSGQYDAAVASYRRSVELCSELGDRYHVAEVLTRLGEAHAVAGRPTQAQFAWRQALNIFEALGHPSAGQVRDRLGAAAAAPADDRSAPAPPHRS